VEWPTLAVASVVYGSWTGLTLWHEAIPAFALVPLAAWTIAWHSSLQHEILHGHPTRWRGLNRALAAMPLSLWIPFERYRRLHLAHHRDERLTDPLDDPESAYWTREEWVGLGPLGRALVRAQTTLAGRLLIGPAWSIGRFLRSEAKAARGDPALAAIWARHGAGVAALLASLWVVCGLTPWAYAALFVYPGTSLLLVRSFAEHRADEGVERRTAVVEGSPLLALLFLNNNLHAAHHAQPALPWYRLPAWYRANRAALLARNGGLVYAGYGDVARRYLFAPHDRPTHPSDRAPTREAVDVNGTASS
jgi:fatty acid desaturase